MAYKINFDKIIEKLNRAWNTDESYAKMILEESQKSGKTVEEIIKFLRGTVILDDDLIKLIQQTEEFTEGKNWPSWAVLSELNSRISEFLRNKCKKS